MRLILTISSLRIQSGTRRNRRPSLCPYSPECVEGKFSEVGLPLYGVLRSSPRAAVSLCHRPILMWRPEVGELGEEVLVWSHLVLRHPPVRQDGEHVIAHIIGQQTTVVRVANRSRRVVGQDIR